MKLLLVVVMSCNVMSGNRLCKEQMSILHPNKNIVVETAKDDRLYCTLCRLGFVASTTRRTRTTSTNNR